MSIILPIMPDSIGWQQLAHWASLMGISHSTFLNLKAPNHAQVHSTCWYCHVRKWRLLPCSIQSQNLESPFFTFSPIPLPMCQIVLWTLPSQCSQYFLTLSLLFIHTVHSGISSPLDCCNNTVALNGALFSTLNREFTSVNGDFVVVMSWEGSFAKNSAKYSAIHRTCPRKHRIIFSKMPVVLC